MDDHDIKHLVVVEEAPVGIVTTTDITHALAPDTAALVEEFLPPT
jgi:CBS domain-containing protein